MVTDTIINAIVFLIEELGIFAIGAWVVGWVAKNTIDRYFNRELKEYQAEINKEINDYKNELEKDRLRYSKLHNKRAEITAELYKRFIEFEEDLRSLTHPMEHTGDPSKEDKIEKTAKSGNNFLNYYMKHKIYFPPQICDTVEKLIEESMDIHKRSRLRAAKSQHRQISPEDFEDNIENWKKVNEEDIPELKTELENHFRQMLGVKFEE